MQNDCFQQWFPFWWLRSLFPSLGCSPEVAFVSLPVCAERRGPRPQEMPKACRTHAGLLSRLPVSNASVHANGLHGSISRKTQCVSGESYILQRSVELHWMDALCGVHVQQDQDSKHACDASPDMHTVRFNGISSTHTIFFCLILSSVPLFFLFLIPFQHSPISFIIANCCVFCIKRRSTQMQH